MKKFAFIVFVVGTLLLSSYGAPGVLREGCHVTRGCLKSGPICVIDESGVPKSFENRCMADMESCFRVTYYVEMKEGVC